MKYILTDKNKYLSVHKDTGNYELTTSLTENVKTFERLCDAAAFADKFDGVFDLKVSELNKNKK